MIKKDYIIIAKAIKKVDGIKNNKELDKLFLLVQELEIVFKQDNNNFNSDRFEEAIYNKDGLENNTEEYD